MDEKKRRLLVSKGYEVFDTVQAALGLTDAEGVVIELRVMLAEKVRERLVAQGMTQKQLAARMGTSQPRVAHMLAGRSVTIDQLVSAYIALGASGDELAMTIGTILREMPRERAAEGPKPKQAKKVPRRRAQRKKPAARAAA